MKMPRFALLALAIGAASPVFAQDATIITDEVTVITDGDATVEAPVATPPAEGDIVLPDTLPDGRTIWNTDPQATEYQTVKGDTVRIGGLLQKMVTDAAIADEMCRGGINESAEQMTGCAVRDYLNTALADFDICEDRYLDETHNAFVRVYAQCAD